MLTQANLRRKKAGTISAGQLGDHVRTNTIIVVNSMVGYQASFRFTPLATFLTLQPQDLEAVEQGWVLVDPETNRQWNQRQDFDALRLHVLRAFRLTHCSRWSTWVVHIVAMRQWNGPRHELARLSENHLRECSVKIRKTNNGVRNAALVIRVAVFPSGASPVILIGSADIKTEQVRAGPADETRPAMAKQYLRLTRSTRASGRQNKVGNGFLYGTINVRHQLTKYTTSTVDTRSQQMVHLDYKGGDVMPDSVGKKSVFERELGWSGLGWSLDSNSIHLLLVQKTWRLLHTPTVVGGPGTSETIRRILNTANIRVGFQRGNTLRSALVQLRDRLPANRTRDCVYKIKCSDCIKVYIGQTARELHTRIGEHKRKINKPPRNADEYRASLKDSAIAEHALDTGHKIDLENVEVLRRGLRSTSQRLMAEAVEIAKHPSVNRIEGVELARVWRTVLDQSS
ncbi:hypothetical protein CLF_101146 [Clonorchis sinensis]|uniref:C2H2-type domain-containing protein n=1 Tax=Clonorchis sinensis TaxID=79923 RepID=G7Y546_CLOSI|nr:hypothetical protein CLF_101146 [Clonorchis sinensis]